jgi:hypothetical protein
MVGMALVTIGITLFTLASQRGMRQPSRPHAN